MVSNEVVVGIMLFSLAVVYALLDVDESFSKDNQESKRHPVLIYSFNYTIGYFQILFKALLALLFVFIFLMVYNFILVGVFKPLISDSVNAGTQSSLPYEQIVSKAKEGYYQLIAAVTKHIFTTVFQIVDIKLIFAMMFLVVPLFIFVVVTTYYLTIARSKKMENIVDTDEDYRVRSTNYHFLTLLIISIIILSTCWIAFIGIKGCNKI
jgi:hypothetical protein